MGRTENVPIATLRMEILEAAVRHTYIHILFCLHRTESCWQVLTCCLNFWLISHQRFWCAGSSGLNIMCAQHMSRRDLNALIDAALTTWPGRLFQSLTTRIEKNFNLRVVEHRFFFSLYLCPLVVFSSTSTGRAETWYSPCVYLYTSIMSPLFRRYESEGRASFFSRVA